MVEISVAYVAVLSYHSIFISVYSFFIPSTVPLIYLSAAAFFTISLTIDPYAAALVFLTSAVSVHVDCKAALYI